MFYYKTISNRNSLFKTDSYNLQYEFVIEMCNYENTEMPY